MRMYACVLILIAHTSLAGPVSDKYEAIIKDKTPSKIVFDAFTNLPPPGVKEIAMERTGCFGTCPAYYISFKSDGSVTYEGYAFTKSGKYSAQISPGVFRRLALFAIAIGCNNYESTYSSQGRDGSTTFTYVRYSGSETVIRNYANSAPIQVQAFEDLIDKAMDSVEWIDQSKSKGLRTKLDMLHMDYECKDLNLVAALQKLGRDATASDPEGTGILFSIDPTLSESRSITFSVKMASATQVIKSLCAIGEVDFCVEESVVSVFRKREP